MGYIWLVSIVYLGVFSVDVTSGLGLLNKCIERHENRVLITCPPNHVIYNFHIFAGKSSDGTCRFQDGDCIGLTPSLRQQKEKCQWHRRCNVKWRSGESLSGSDLWNVSSRCQNQEPDYVSLNIPKCLHTGAIIDICSDLREIDQEEGVIRSPVSNILLPGHQSRVCVKHILSQNESDVELTIDESTVRENNSLQIWNVDAEGRKEPALVSKGVRMRVKAGGWIEIIFSAVDIGHEDFGFSVSFSRRSSVEPDVGTVYGQDIDTALKRVDSANVQECMSAKTKFSTLSCPSGQWIYRPQVSAIVSRTGSCRTFRENCEGLTPDLMVQTFRCYWENSCQLLINGQIPIAWSVDWRCVGRIASFSSVKRHLCVRRDEVFNICDGEAMEIDQPQRGLIRSHASYPWNYGVPGSGCRRRIKNDNNQKVVITADEIDLDPEGGDVITIFHEVGDSRREVFRSSDSLGLNLSLSEGTVEIVFNVSIETKSGRGFVILFQKSSSSVDNESKSGSSIVSNRKSGSSKKSSRKEAKKKLRGRRKPKRQRRRRKNRKDRKGKKRRRSL